jgi:hypothetical protein
MNDVVGHLVGWLPIERLDQQIFMIVFSEMKLRKLLVCGGLLDISAMKANESSEREPSASGPGSAVS